MNHSDPIRLVSVNTEHSRHLARLEPFLREKRPQVLCLQELRESSLPLIRDIMGVKESCFVPILRLTDDVTRESDREGLAIFTTLPCSQDPAFRYYVWNGEETPPHENGPYLGQNRALAWITVTHAGEEYRFATIHHTWSPGDHTSDEQRRDTGLLLELLSEHLSLIFCGDSNAPRVMPNGTPGETFHRIAERYRDHIPTHITSTIDPELHRAAPLNLVVDVLFSTEDYDIRNVEVIPGISDHCALVADVRKKKKALP